MPSSLHAGGSPAALSIRPRLGAIAAHLHGAPGAGTILRVVVERPGAAVLTTGLEARPGALGGGSMNDREQPAERPVDALCLGLDQTLAARIEAQTQNRPARHLVELRRGLPRRATAVVVRQQN